MTLENPIINENKKVGTADWILTNPATEREIEGYASATSVNKGESIFLYVNTKSHIFELDVFRMGWYQGLGGRKMFHAARLEGISQAMPHVEVDSGLINCNWKNSYKLNTFNTHNDTDWLSGIYLVKLTENQTGKQSYITFVVRDDQRHADLLFQQSVTTYQAYNNWGGKSFYKWNSTDNKRASKLSFNRPYAGNQQNSAAAYGIGAGEFICNVQPNNSDYPISNAGWEYNMVRWLEREGYNVAYCTNIDIHENKHLLFNYRAFLSVGHDEYWSLAMRNNIEHALSSGTHLGFFGANIGYWQIRFEDCKPSEEKNRIIVCHKAAKRDPYLTKSQRHHLLTCQWREEPVSRPEAQLLGVMYTADPVDGDIIIIKAEHRLFKGTGAVNGTKLSGLLGYEVDSVHDSSPVTVEILAHSPWTKLNDSQQSGCAQMTYYVTQHGASVFATGSIQWCWALDDFNAPQLRSNRNNPVAQQLTRNVLDSFISDAVKL